ISSTTFAIGVPKTLFVLARLEGRTAIGMTGAEFRVAGIPDDWVVLGTPNPDANIVLGDPFHDAGGVRRGNIAFSSCTMGNNGLVLLYTAVVVPRSSIGATDFTIEGGQPPSNPNFPHAIFTLCDAPDYTKVVAASHPFHVETRAPQDLDY